MELFRHQDDSNQPVKISLRCSVTLVDCQRLLERKGVKKDGGYFVYLLTGEENCQCSFNQEKTKAQPCPDCGKRSSQIDTMRLHQTVQTGDEPYSCSQREKSFSEKEDLQAHDRTDTKTLHSCSPGGQAAHFPAHREGLEVYSCFMCGFECRNFEVLEQHTRKVHHVGNIYSCPKCKESFDSLALLAEHDEMQHKNKAEQSSYKCTQCKESYSGLEDLRKHMQHHEISKKKVPKPFKCDRCELGFRTMKELEKHTPTHEKKKYKCTTCGDSFTTEGHRISHLRVHVSEVNYHSDKIFGTASTPRGSKGIFPCTMCQKTFSTLVQLRNHQRCHST